MGLLWDDYDMTVRWQWYDCDMAEWLLVKIEYLIFNFMLLYCTFFDAESTGRFLGDDCQWLWDYGKMS